jgi:hypothetical protein
VLCPLCGIRKARRACPAIHDQICTVCCGTKRLTEIACPSDCVYLAAAREHPPAAAVRQQQQDFTVFVKALADFNRRQAQLFLAINTVIARYEAPELQAVVDDDVIEAASVLAATYETASRGVIYEHRASTLSAERLGTAIRAMLREVGGAGGSAFERDVAVVLRRVEQTAQTAHASGGGDSRAYFKLLDRVLSRREEEAPGGTPSDTETDRASRLILP